MNRKGYRIRSLFACGGGTKNPVFLREHATITGCEIILSREPEAVLLGSAMLGAVASGLYPKVIDAMTRMSGVDRVIRPEGGKIAAYHDRKYRIFHQMHRDFLNYRKIMDKK
jgi:ribulose kinase